MEADSSNLQVLEMQNYSANHAAVPHLSDEKRHRNTKKPQKQQIQKDEEEGEEAEELDDYELGGPDKIEVEF